VQGQGHGLPHKSGCAGRSAEWADSQASDQRRAASPPPRCAAAAVGLGRASVRVHPSRVAVVGDRGNGLFADAAPLRRRAATPARSLSYLSWCGRPVAAPGPASGGRLLFVFETRVRLGYILLRGEKEKLFDVE